MLLIKCNHLNIYLKNNLFLKIKTMIVYTHKIIPPQPPESEDGNTEYKIYLSPNYESRKNRRQPKNEKIKKMWFQSYIQNKSTQLLFRLIEGNGKALYLLGIEDNGKVRGMNSQEMFLSLENIRLMAHQIGAIIRIIRVYQGGKGHVCTVRLFLPESIYHQKVKNSII